MKVTNLMLTKWAKAALLILFGIILIIYLNSVLEELQRAFESILQVETPMLISLLTAVMWIIILWCFVDAAINIITSFREGRTTIDDLAAKIDSIEKMIKEQGVEVPPAQQKPIVIEQAKVQMSKSEPMSAPTSDVPPPPP